VDGTCDDLSAQERAELILQRLKDKFEYKDNELTLTTATNDTLSFAQKAYDWIVHANETSICPDSTNLFQRFVLAIFYFACGGTKWSMPEEEHYLESSVNECEWYGIACDDNQTVIGLHLDNSSIVGTLPTELAMLRNVQELNIDANQIVGPIPSWFDQWTGLEVIDMDHNFLTGSIPSSLYSLSFLRVLDLDGNSLTGSISESGLANWKETLYFLQLDFNQLIGSIPSILGEFPVLQYLSIFGNNFTDTILSAIENLCNEDIGRTIYANCNLCQNSTCCAACLDV
jgi:Leucine-rich repeat (LRR) protein